MTPAEAGRILGISPKADMEQIKKQYRRLMHQFHPDVSGSSKTSYRYSVQEINLAYAVLKKSLSDPEVSLSSGEKKRPFSKNLHWDAPLNQHAWIEREILHYAEDYEGNVIGNFTIARGKYLWTEEEDFSLFLLSIYRCGQELLDEIDAELEREENSALRLRFQPQLTYLLAQQFMDGLGLLRELARMERKAERDSEKGNDGGEGEGSGGILPGCHGGAGGRREAGASRGGPVSGPAEGSPAVSERRGRPGDGISFLPG